MQKDTTYDILYNDYCTIKKEWPTCLDELNAALDSLQGQRNLLRDLKADQDIMEANVLLAEEHKEGAINGSNEPKRKRQASVLLARLRETDPDWIQLAQSIRQVEVAIEDAEIRKDKAQNTISFLRNHSRLVSGLANALAG